MSDSEHRIDHHKIIAGTTISILSLLLVTPKTTESKFYKDWITNPELININIDFAIFTNHCLLSNFDISLEVIISYLKKNEKEMTLEMQNNEDVGSVK